MGTRQIDLVDFAAHCLDEMLAIRRDDTVLEVLGDGGEILAVINPPPAGAEGTLGDWMGSGAAITGDLSDIDQPAFMDVDDAQDFWNDLSAERYAELQRVPVTRRPEDFFGDGSGEEWEGFDEALEQWRSEKIPTGEQPHAA